MDFESICKKVPKGVKMSLNGEGMRVKIEIDLYFDSLEYPKVR